MAMNKRLGDQRIEKTIAIIITCVSSSISMLHLPRIISKKPHGLQVDRNVWVGFLPLRLLPSLPLPTTVDRHIDVLPSLSLLQDLDTTTTLPLHRYRCDLSTNNQNAISISSPAAAPLSCAGPLGAMERRHIAS